MKLFSHLVLMSDLRRKLFEWLDPDWLEEAGRFPVPGGGHGGDHRGNHDGDNGGDHGRDHGDVMVIMVVIDKNTSLVGVLMAITVIIMIKKVMTVFYMMLELMTSITVLVTSIVHRSMCGWVKHPGKLPV